MCNRKGLSLCLLNMQKIPKMGQISFRLMKIDLFYFNAASRPNKSKFAKIGFQDSVHACAIFGKIVCICVLTRDEYVLSNTKPLSAQ